MKLHEKILTHFLSCTSPVDKEGYLYKKKERNATYYRRWFVLKANLLFYQERPADRHLLGVIVLEGCTVQMLDSDGFFPFALQFGSGLKTYRFAAGDAQTQGRWVKALFLASHCYLSNLVRDLGRQYEEAKQQQDPTNSCSSLKSLSPPTNSLLVPALFPLSLVREGRSFSASDALPPPSMPTKMAAKKSPKKWPRRNAHVTPLNGPAPPYGEWPLVGSDPLVEFSKLHDFYGQEVKKAREEWLRSRQTEKEQREKDLIDLG
ncbi:sesquipedalian-1 [Poecilia latipinna]|uniref:Sesquipedalian n=1 Tax=Poecilia latipinna TaxID=48699 RepID=A0A3B3U3A8_9TELE|nr:PREDICTED: sesquipedalian-1-like [Poecilia latipinna]XP_014910096.1 PREDICTED: sesquipedalian-1-like [Poecilia latipinna]